MGTLTVRENLRFSAALRLPRAVPPAEREARVGRLIQELGLAKVADAKVAPPLPPLSPQITPSPSLPPSLSLSHVYLSRYS